MSGEVLREPTPGALASYLGLTTENIPNRCFDLVVIGGGPRPCSRRLRRFRGAEDACIEIPCRWPGRLDLAYRDDLGSRPASPAEISLNTAFVQAEKFGAPSCRFHVLQTHSRGGGSPGRPAQ